MAKAPNQAAGGPRGYVPFRTYPNNPPCRLRLRAPRFSKGYSDRLLVLFEGLPAFHTLFAMPSRASDTRRPAGRRILTILTTPPFTNIRYVNPWRGAGASPGPPVRRPAPDPA